MKKPRIFIASSAEGLQVAEAVNLNLDHDLETTLWKSGTFNLSSSTIDDLVKKSSSVDFAVFIFTPDDITTIREHTTPTVRDNVLFELGLFIGALGKDRSYIVKPRSVDLHLPTDLLGLTTADYDPERSDDDLFSATNQACTLVKRAVSKMGTLERTGSRAQVKPTVNPDTYVLTEIDLTVLASCVQSHTDSPTGVTAWWLDQKLSCGIQSIRIALVRLERLGYVERFLVETDYNREASFSYSITDDGLTAVNSTYREEVDRPQSRTARDEDVPF